ncbi:MAG: SLBB domain-containing protein [Ignavibacteria bacterium]|jgi:protein involved in polysaccharide export with SLBB domain
MLKKLLVISLLCVLSSYAQVNLSTDNSSSSNFSSLPISVTIGGDFIITGSFPAYGGERLDQFITRIYNEALSKLQVPANNENVFLHLVSEAKDYALREITLKRKDGTTKLIDLLKFRLTGNFENNPYLQNDDVIIFPSYDSEYEVVEINGAVKKPTKFQFVEGDKLSDAIFFAHGINKAYEDSDTAVVSRLSYDGTKEELIEVGLNDEFYLKPGDRIRIKADQTKRKSYKILVLGEVKNPGEIYITENSTTIKEAIEKAGGFTEKASLKDAELVRNFTKQQILLNEALKMKADENPSVLIKLENEVSMEYIKELLRMNRTADLQIDDTLYFNISNQLRILEGENGIDFRELDSTNSIASQFIVRDGDVIVVPQKLESVYVFGQVGVPGYYQYSEGSDYLYYISQAGGLTETAKDDDDIYVIKGKGRKWISIEEKNYEIEPGDYIYVLKEIPRNIWFYVSRIGTVASILGSIATVVLLFINISSE